MSDTPKISNALRRGINACHVAGMPNAAEELRAALPLAEKLEQELTGLRIEVLDKFKKLQAENNSLCDWKESAAEVMKQNDHWREKIQAMLDAKYWGFNYLEAVHDTICYLRAELEQAKAKPGFATGLSYGRNECKSEISDLRSQFEQLKSEKRQAEEAAIRAGWDLTTLRVDLSNVIDGLGKEVEQLKAGHFVPTASSINALPDSLRNYIHDLATRCDPSGEVQTMACQKEQIASLLVQVEQLKADSERLDLILDNERFSAMLWFKKQPDSSRLPVHIKDRETIDAMKESQ